MLVTASGSRGLCVNELNMEETEVDRRDLSEAAANEAWKGNGAPSSLRTFRALKNTI